MPASAVNPSISTFSSEAANVIVSVADETLILVPCSIVLKAKFTPVLALNTPAPTPTLEAVLVSPEPVVVPNV